MSASNCEMIYPPMLPLIAHDAKFVFATDLEVQQFASNAALCAQVHDSLACWLSHIKDVHQERQGLLDWLDALHVIDPLEVEPKFVQMELVLSFHLHFDRREVLACTRLLQYVPKAATQLEDLARELLVIRSYHEELTHSLSFLSGVCDFIRTPWAVGDVADTMPPMFSALRAMWVCAPLFGPEKGRSRFSAAVAYVVQRVERVCHDAGCRVVSDLIERPSVALSVKRNLVGAQDAIVAVQEQYYSLLTSLSACGVVGTAGVHTVFSDVDDVALFSMAEWQFERCKGLLLCVDALKEHPDKIGSSLTDPLSHVDLMDPDALSQTQFLKYLDDIVHEDSPSADAILSRMEQKQAALLGPSSTSKASAAAPRVPFDQLSGGLCVTVSFNPPVVTVMGGPVSVGFLDTAQFTLPMCCSNTQTRGAISKKAIDALFVKVADNVHQLVLRGMFCDEVNVVSLLVALLDIVEAEDAWKMTDVLGQHIDGKEVHTLHFRKHRSKKKQRRAGSRSQSISPLSASGSVRDRTSPLPDGYDPTGGQCKTPVAAVRKLH